MVPVTQCVCRAPGSGPGLIRVDPEDGSEYLSRQSKETPPRPRFPQEIAGPNVRPY